MWPVALLSHTGAAGARRRLRRFEVWESQQAQTKWMASRLGPALTQAGLPEPKGAMADRRGALQRMNSAGGGGASLLAHHPTGRRAPRLPSRCPGRHRTSRWCAKPVGGLAAPATPIGKEVLS